MARYNTVGKVATSISHRDGFTCVTYHNTDVVKFNENQIILDTGGWRSATTKVRMIQTSNQFGLGFGVFQKQYDWFVTYKGKCIPFEGQKLILNRKEEENADNAS